MDTGDPIRGFDNRANVRSDDASFETFDLLANDGSDLFWANSHSSLLSAAAGDALAEAVQPRTNAAVDEVIADAQNCPTEHFPRDIFLECHFRRAGSGTDGSGQLRARVVREGHCRGDVCADDTALIVEELVKNFDDLLDKGEGDACARASGRS